MHTSQVNAALAAPVCIVVAACMSTWSASGQVQGLLEAVLPMWAGVWVCVCVCVDDDDDDDDDDYAGMMAQGSFAYLLGGYLQVCCC